MLKRPNSGVSCALETTASFLALPVPCIPGPGPDGRARPRGPGNEDEFEIFSFRTLRHRQFVASQKES